MPSTDDLDGYYLDISPLIEIAGDSDLPGAASVLHESMDATREEIRNRAQKRRPRKGTA
jgi:hypothetical protein